VGISGAIIRLVERQCEGLSPGLTETAAPAKRCNDEAATGDRFCSFHRKVADGLVTNTARQPRADLKVRGYEWAAGGEAPEPQFVRLTWRDAWVDEDERQVKDFADDLIVTTVGYLVRTTEDLISVAAERLVQDGKVTYRSTTHVWRCMLLGEPEALLPP
jgi:hypothetical protein